MAVSSTQQHEHEKAKPSCYNTDPSSLFEFQMPLHYPRYKKKDYLEMPEWKLDRLLTQYGLPLTGDVHQNRRFAIGAFLWPTQQDD